MKIKSIEIEGLHGYLNKKINFCKDENYLVGINGSGKSTILKIIKSFFDKNLEYLEKIDYESIKIETDINEFTFSRPLKEEVRVYNPVTDYIMKNKFKEIIKNKEEPSELIQEFEKIIEENIPYTYSAKFFHLFNDIENNLLNLGLEPENLEEKLIELNSIKKEEIEEPLDMFMNTIIPIREIQKILKVEGGNHLKKVRLNIALSNNEKKLKGLNKKKEALNGIEDMLLDLKIEKLKKEIDSLRIKEEELGNILSFDEFVNIINLFLKDSYKKLSFDYIEGEFKIQLLENNIEKNINNFKYLSSGEKQILILFTKVYFHMKKDSIILIDEPESSLHIKWQKIFIESLKKAVGSNYNPQIIVATHSPFIVDKVDRNKIISIYPYNREDDEDE